MGVHTKYHDDRDPQIVAARMRGSTYKEIGDMWGITPVRVRQIVRKSERMAALAKLKQLNDDAE